MLLRLSLLLSASLFCTLCSATTTTPTEAVQYTLDNGLRVVFLPSNHDASDTAEVSLLLRAGSLVESDAQRGYAHFIEHMAFSGTERFPKEIQVRDELRALGIEIDDHVAAHTSFDQTLYSLHLENAQPDKLKRALVLLAQWADKISFNENAVNAERPIVLSELRAREREKTRATEQLLDIYFADSCYATRRPIGTEASIKQATAEQLRAYYQKWYRPANAAVLLSGNIDLAQAMTIIRAEFSDWQTGGALVPQPCDVHPEQRSEEILVHDAQLPYPTVQLNWHLPQTQWPSARTQRLRLLAQTLALKGLSTRLQAHLHDSAGAISGFYADYYNESPKQQLVMLGAAVPGGDVHTGLSALGAGLKSLRSTPLNVDELQALKQEFLQDMEGYALNARQSTGILIEHILHNRPAWTQAQRLDWVRDALAQIDTEQVALAIKPWLHQSPKIQAVVSNRTDIDEQSLRQAVEQSTPLQLAQSHHDPKGWPITQQLEPKLVETKQFAGDLNYWRFANGLTVLHRHTDVLPGQISWTLTGEGFNVLAPEKSTAARLAPPILRSSGLRQLNESQLQAWLKREGISLYPTYEFAERSIYGDGPAAKIDTQMRLLYVALTEAKVDPRAMAHVIQTKVSERTQWEHVPSKIISDWWTKVIRRGDIAFRTLEISELEQLDHDAITDLYQQHYRGLRNDVLAIVGDIDAEQALAAVRQSIAGLTNTIATRPARLLPVESHSGDYHLSGRDAREASGTQRWLMPDQNLTDSEFALFLRWLNTELFEEVRERQGLVYSIHANSDKPTPNNPTWLVEIGFETNPDDVEQVYEKIDEVLTRMRKTPPDAQTLQSWLDVQRDHLLQRWASPRPSRQASALAHATQQGRSYAHYFDIEQRIKAVSAERLLTILQSLDQERSVMTKMYWTP